MATREKHVIIVHQFLPAWSIQAFMRFSNIPFTVNNSRYPRFAAHGDLPNVQHGSMFVGADRAIAYLKRIGDHSLDDSLTDEQAAHLHALSTLVSTTLAEVEQWCLLHSDAHNSLISSVLPAPLSWFVPRAIRQQWSSRLQSGNMIDARWVKSVAMNAYRHLAALLAHSDGPYFFGTQPTSLDALVFGHLATVRHLHAAAWVVEAAPSLCEYYSHVVKVYFTSSSGSSSQTSTKPAWAARAASTTAPEVVATPTWQPDAMPGCRPNMFMALDKAIDDKMAERARIEAESRALVAAPSQDEATVPPPKPQPAPAKPKQEAAKEKVTEHGRHLTGMAAVDVSERRETFEGRFRRISQGKLEEAEPAVVPASSPPAAGSPSPSSQPPATRPGFVHDPILALQAIRSLPDTVYAQQQEHISSAAVLALGGAAAGLLYSWSTQV